jgi:hypothetical protein
MRRKIPQALLDCGDGIKTNGDLEQVNFDAVGIVDP